MSKTERFRLLLGEGYFPDELPPPFTTREFAKYRESLYLKWKTVNADYPKSISENYSNPRVKRTRRNLSIPNPICQLFLCKIISDNWSKIRSELKKSRYSVETPEITSGKTRAVSPPDFSLVSLRRA